MGKWIKIALASIWCFLALPAFGATTFEGMMNDIIRGAPGTKNIPITSGGVSAEAVGSITVGADVAVPTTVAARVSAGAIARGVARVGLRALPWVGTAVTVAEIANAVKDSGIKTCPPPAFFCKPSGSVPVVPATPMFSYSGGAGTTPYLGSAVDACTTYISMRSSTPQAGTSDRVPYYVEKSPTASPYTCGYYNPDYTMPAGNKYAESHFSINASIKYVCDDGKESTTPFDCNAVAGDPNVSVPASEDDIYAQLSAKANADHDWALKMKAQMDAVAQANPAYAPPIDVSDAPLTVTAPQTTGPTKVVSTETIPNADGSTSTKVVKETTTVTPVVGSPSTVANPNVSYPSTTTRSTTITNNTTNVSTTTVTNVNNPPMVPAPLKPQDLPTDYNREKTQQKILDSLTTPITEAAPDGANDLKAVKDQNDANSNALNSINEGSTGLRSWLPTIKTAQCVNPQVPTPITGSLLSVPICDSVNMFAKFISAVISVFALYGCIREVQAAMKA